MLRKTVPDLYSSDWKSSRPRLRVGYGEQTVRKTKRNTDDFKTPTLLDDKVRQRGMTVPDRKNFVVLSLLFYTVQTAVKLSSAEATDRAQCAVPD